MAVFRSVRTVAVAASVLAVSVVLVACGGSGDSGPAVPSRPAGTVADSGFRPGPDGLPFSNYGLSLADGAIPINMTAADVEKMFGQVVCVDAKSRKCDLIPEAQDWLDATNQAMSGGHCYGFSVLADLLWQGRLAAATFGASTVGSLQISSNSGLQRQIAYDWALQTLPSVQTKRVSGTPNKILLTLMDALNRNATHAYTIVIWKKDGTGGHAVTPYAVLSRGGGRYDVLIYDNNWPDQTRMISFDTATNTWSYQASTNPSEANSLYEGDAGSKTLALDPADPGLGVQPCPFCGKVPDKPSVTAAGGGNVLAVSLMGGGGSHANLVVSDDAGHKLGYINGTYVDQIHGGSDAPVISGEDWTNQAEPEFYLPADRRYTFTLDGRHLTAADDETLNIVGSSFDLAIKNIVMRPGDTDTLVLEPDATELSYTSSRPESPAIDIGVSDSHDDYSFEITGASERPGGTLNVVLPAEGSTLAVQTVGSAATSRVSVSMTRGTQQGVQAFQSGPWTLASGDRADLQFSTWTDPAQPAPLVVQRTGA